MKKKCYSTEQIVAALKQAELGMAVADLVHQLGISEMTYYRWKKRYGGLESDQVRELKQVLDENARLKKLLAELSLDKAVLQDVLSKKFPDLRPESRHDLSADFEMRVLGGRDVFQKGRPRRAGALTIACPLFSTCRSVNMS